MITTTDPIADMLTRIRNAINVNNNQTNVPYSKFKESVLKLLKTNGFISGYKVDNNLKKNISITIFEENTNPRISELKKVSKPGRRAYVNSKEIPVVKQGKGILILSTSKGLLTGSEARKLNVGGEIICEVV